MFSSLVRKRNESYFFSITGFLVSRWVSSGHFPLSNLYESLIFLSWALYILRTIPKIQNSKNDLNTMITPTTILMCF
jgi:ABC-type transport system involved in cytochrome c biogenesis permease subunit